MNQALGFLVFTVHLLQVTGRSSASRPLPLHLGLFLGPWPLFAAEVPPPPSRGPASFSPAPSTVPVFPTPQLTLIPSAVSASRHRTPNALTGVWAVPPCHFTFSRGSFGWFPRPPLANRRLCPSGFCLPAVIPDAEWTGFSRQTGPP